MRWKKQYNNQNDILTKQLLLSCAYGDLEAVQDCLHQSASSAGSGSGNNHDLIHCTEPELGWTPLHVACYRRNADMVELLLNEGANPNICASDGYAPLRLIVVIGSTPTSTDQDGGGGGDAHVVNEEEEHNYCRIIEALLQHGADPCGCVDARSVASPLHVAAQNGKLHMVELLIEYGAFFHVQKAKETKTNGRNNRSKKIAATTTTTTNTKPKRMSMSMMPVGGRKHKIPRRLSMTMNTNYDNDAEATAGDIMDSFPTVPDNKKHDGEDEDEETENTDVADETVTEEESTTTLTPLAIACRQGHGHVVEYLLHNVMPPTIVLGDAELMIPFREACYNYHVDCIVRLLSYGLEIMHESQTHDNNVDVDAVVESLIKIAFDPMGDDSEQRPQKIQEGEEENGEESEEQNQDDPETKRLKNEAFRLELFREACRAHMVDVIVPLLPYMDAHILDQDDEQELALPVHHGDSQHLHEDTAITYSTNNFDEESDEDDASLRKPRSLKSALVRVVDPNNDQTVLHRVCAKKNIEWVRKLLQFAREQRQDAVDEIEEKEDDEKDVEDCLAASGEKATSCSALGRLENAVDVDLQTALHLACKVDFLEGVRCLMECSQIDTNVEDINGDTPLMLTQGEDVARCILRLQQHPDRISDLINRRNFQTGQTRLHTASCEGNFNLCHTLLQLGADPNIGNFQGCTALYLASVRGFAQICTSLLAQGADLTIATANLSTDGMHAALSIGPQPDAVVGGDTPLHAACRSGHLGVVLRLHGANVEAVNAKGRTPLHDACEQGHVDVVEFLLTERQARLDVTDRPEGGFTPFELACHARRRDVIYYLIRYHAEHGRAGTMPFHTPKSRTSYVTELDTVALIQKERSFGRRFGVVPDYDSVASWNDEDYLLDQSEISHKSHKEGLRTFLRDAVSWGADEGVSCCSRTVSSCTTVGDHAAVTQSEAPESKWLDSQLSWNFWKEYYLETS